MTESAGAALSAAGTPVLIHTQGAVRRITLNRPEALNAFDEATKAAFSTALEAAADDRSVRAVVITGAGRAFCAGQDLKEHLTRMAANDPAVARTVTGFYNPVIQTIADMRKPVIAAINGVAAGAGVGVALACDLRVATESASMTMAFAQVALSTDSGVSYFLPRIVGAGRAMRMILLGEKVPAAEALRIGLVDEVVRDEDFPARVGELAGRLAAGPTGAYAWIKSSLVHGATHTLAETLEFENRAQTASFASRDHREALDAFAAKRPPVFGPVP